MSSSGKSKTETPKLKKASVVVIRTEWNAAIVDELFAGCKKILESAKIEWQDYRVPGALKFHLP